MNVSRRRFVRLGLGAALSSSAHRLLGQQGMGGHTTKAMPRGAPSGRPFNAHLVDVAASAGLRAPVIYGDEEAKKYIVESTGCGCAFIDYDNDGWMDLFILSGTRLEGAPEGTTNRLYKNNRDGTFTDVTDKAGLHALGWACGVCIGDYNNDGFDDIFCHHFGQNILYRNNGDGTFTDVTMAAGLWNESHAVAQAAAFSTTTAMDTLICSSRIMCGFTFESAARSRQRIPTAVGKGFRSNADRAVCRRENIRSITTMATGNFTDVSKEARISQAPATLWDDSGRSRL